jgi:hypothetical protein
MATLVALAALATDLVPARAWLERLAFLVPGGAATRWLLVADLACLVAMGCTARSPLLGVPVSLGLGFVGLNLLGMAVTDFHLGLALFQMGDVAYFLTLSELPYRASSAPGQGFAPGTIVVALPIHSGRQPGEIPPCLARFAWRRQPSPPLTSKQQHVFLPLLPRAWCPRPHSSLTSPAASGRGRRAASRRPG